MKAAVASKLGEFKEVIRVLPDVIVPQITKPTQLLIKVKACSLSPGDCRRVNGDISLVFKAKKPYVVGMDVCGVVEEIGDQATFKKGDCIISTNGTFRNGMAEYAVVESKYSQVIPQGLSPIEACCIQNSGLRAMWIAEKIKKGDRVIVLGGSGGFGCFLVQLLKLKGASYVAATSTQQELLTNLGVDHVIDYTKENWADLERYKDNKFDVLIDCVNTSIHWPLAVQTDVLKKNKQGGRYIGVTMDNPKMQISSISGFIGLMSKPLWRQIWTAYSSKAPRYKMGLLNDVSKTEELDKILKYVTDGKLKVVLDPRSPYPFTTDGVQQAYIDLWDCHAHGKIVVEIES